ncbi:MAG: substrate-binding domain-containing protein [Treponema sp.]|jgi:rhamnose transport system substrate-binding protein|nr:substrate-binding domain-containing protein [Treponema sp.]
MKTLKKMAAGALCVCLTFAVLGCSGGQKPGKEDGVNAWVFKSSGIIFGDLLYQGFKEVMDSKGEKSTYQAPAEPTVTAQVQILDELITQGVKSISISTNGDQGYDRIMQKAKDAGVPLFSADSALSPDLRVTHINPTSQTGIGTALIQAAVLINLRIPYPADKDLAKAVNAALASYNGPEMKFGVLSASVDTPVQNGWIVKMHEELQKDIYKGKVNPELDVKYGNDVLTESTTQANAFISENKVSVIISPTTIGMAAAGQALSAAPNSGIKLTGLGLPSEMQSFMPLSPNDDEFSKVCPYMMLWDVIDMGRVLAGAAYAATQGTFDGKPGSSFQLDAYSSYPARTYKAENDPDGKPGTVVIVGDPYVFYKDNMADWINVL